MWVYQAGREGDERSLIELRMCTTTFAASAFGIAANNGTQQQTQQCISQFNNTAFGKFVNFWSMASPFMGPDRLGLVAHAASLGDNLEIIEEAHCQLGLILFTARNYPDAWKHFNKVRESKLTSSLWLPTALEYLNAIEQTGPGTSVI